MAKEFNSEVYVKNLPDYYRKDANSNNYKILEIEKHALRKLDEDISAVYDTLDIWKATGKTLDLYGEMYNQPREGLEDDPYRVLILLKMVRNRAGSDHTSIINALTAALGLPADIFNIVDSEISGNVDVLALPYNVLQESGIGVKQVWLNIRALLGAAIGIDKFNIVQDTPQNDLVIATANTYGERFTIEIKAKAYENVNTTLETAPVTVQSEINEVEVK